MQMPAIHFLTAMPYFWRKCDWKSWCIQNFVMHIYDTNYCWCPGLYHWTCCLLEYYFVLCFGQVRKFDNLILKQPQFITTTQNDQVSQLMHNTVWNLFCVARKIIPLNGFYCHLMHATSKVTLVITEHQPFDISFKKRVNN